MPWEDHRSNPLRFSSSSELKQNFPEFLWMFYFAREHVCWFEPNEAIFLEIHLTWLVRNLLQRGRNLLHFFQLPNIKYKVCFGLIFHSTSCGFICKEKLKQSELILFLHRVTCVFMIQFTNLFTLLFPLALWNFNTSWIYATVCARKSIDRHIRIQTSRIRHSVGRSPNPHTTNEIDSENNMHMQQSCANFAGMTTNGWRTSEATTQHMKPQNRAAFLTLRICINDMATRGKSQVQPTRLHCCRRYMRWNLDLSIHAKKKSHNADEKFQPKKLSIRLARRPVVWLVVAVAKHFNRTQIWIRLKLKHKISFSPRRIHRSQRRQQKQQFHNEKCV